MRKIYAKDFVTVCACFPLAVDWQAHHNAIFDVEWMPAENQLLTASGDLNIALWDVAGESCIASFHGHTSSIKSVSVVPSNNGWYHIVESVLC